MALKSKNLDKVRDDLPLELVRGDLPKKGEKGEKVRGAAPEDHARLSLNIAKDAHKKLRALAVEKETTVTDLILAAVKNSYGI